MNQGAAYYFRNLAISGPTATESSKLIASDGAPNDYFGSAVSLSASTTTALIGAPFAQVNSSYNQGAAYLFRDLVSSTGTITQQVKLVASNSSSGGIGALFGSSVSLSPSEKQALVGAPSDSSQGDDPISFQDRGAVYYFSNLDTAAGVVNESLKITASDGKPFDNFGSSVDFGGDRFVIGAWHGDGASASTGKAYSGSINSMTTIDRGNSRTTNGLSFTSQMDWIVGKSSFLNEVTLSAGDYANITATGKAVYIGVNDESHFNHLTIAGTLVTNGVQIGSQGINFGNNLTIAENGIVETGFIRGALGGENRLKIDGGTIRFTESGTAIANFQAGDIRILNQGATFDTQDNSIAIGTAMAGKGGLTKLGSGTLELSGANTYSGQTLIHEGTLQLGDPSAPSSIAGDVLISKFAGLGGNGIIHGQLVNSGELAPGNSPGIIQVGGAFVQTGTGTLQMEITKDDHDRLITGSGTVLGGTLVLVADGSTFAFGQHFNLIQSDSPITGGFDSIKTSGFNDVREEFKIIGNAGILSIAPESYTQVANTPNEANLATALDNWIDDSDGDTEMVSDSLDQLTAAEYHQAFAAISPALYGAALDTAIEQSQSQSTTLAQHLASRRLREVPATMESKDWEAWAVSTGLYSAGSMSSLAGNEFSSGNFLSGIERKLDATFTAGLFTGFADSVGTFSGASRTEQDRLTFGGYATAQRDGYYATTALGAGILDLDVTRSIRFGNLSRTAKSSTDGSEFFGLVSGGYDLHANNWTFGPTASFQYSKVRYDDVKENGAGALDLAIENPEDDSLRSQIGARVAYLHKASEQLTLIPEARLFWQHEFLRDNSPLDSTLEQGAGPGFSHSIAKSDGDSVSGGVALGFQTPVGFYGNISYDVELGRESNLNQTLSIGADWKF
ncbi:MAG: autotransporter domain-containing protein [Luteolibacter sp.]